MEAVLIVFILQTVLCIACALIADHKGGRHPMRYFLLGFFLSVVGLVITILVCSRRPDDRYDEKYERRIGLAFVLLSAFLLTAIILVSVFLFSVPSIRITNLRMTRLKGKPLEMVFTSLTRTLGLMLTDPKGIPVDLNKVPMNAILKIDISMVVGREALDPEHETSLEIEGLDENGDCFIKREFKDFRKNDNAVQERSLKFLLDYGSGNHLKIVSSIWVGGMVKDSEALEFTPQAGLSSVEASSTAEPLSENNMAAWAANGFRMDDSPQTLARTTNGRNWTDQDSRVSEIEDIDAVSPMVVWATGRKYLDPAPPHAWKPDGGQVTVDGGRTWRAFAQPAGFNAISAVDENTAWASNYDEVYRTTDGGATWLRTQPLEQGYFEDIAALDKDTAIGVGEPGFIARTSDAGQTWQTVLYGTPERFYQVEAGGATTLYVCPESMSKDLLQLSEDEEAGRLLDLMEKGDYPHYQFLKSTDSGLTWQNVPAPDPLQYLRAISVANENVLWALDDHGGVVLSTDGAVSWRKVRLTPEYNRYAQTLPFEITQSVQFISIAAVDEKSAWIGGGVTNMDRTAPMGSDDTDRWGFVGHTADGGATWTDETIGPHEISSISATSE